MNWMVDKLVDTMVDTHHVVLGLARAMGESSFFSTATALNLLY